MLNHVNCPNVIIDFNDNAFANALSNEIVSILRRTSVSTCGETLKESFITPENLDDLKKL